MKWDLQANVSLRKSPHEQFKKLVRNKGQKAVGQKHSRLLEGWRSFLSRSGSFPPAVVHLPHKTFHLQSRKKQRKKDGSSELEPQLCTSECSSTSTLLLTTRPLPRTMVLENQSGPGEKTVFKGVTFHLGTLQPLDPLVWGKQLGLCQVGSPL